MARYNSHLATAAAFALFAILGVVDTGTPRAADILIAQVQPTEDEDTDFLEKLGLMAGHLLVGMQLVDASKVRDGLPHFGHPVSEIYDYIKSELDRRNVPDFYAQLRGLEDQVRKAGGGPQATTQYNEIVAAIDRARASVAVERRRSPKFMLGVIALLLEDTATDYEGAIERGRIANRVEYHDALGFIQHIEVLLRDIRAVAGPEWNDRLKKAGDEVASVHKALPSLDPPAKPVRTVRNLKTSASRVLALAK
jgi:hypothetical protein